MTQSEIKPFDKAVTEVKKTVAKPSARYLRDKDREPVRGKFIFHEVPGGTMSFSIKIHKDDQVENYTLVDGEIYTLPLGVAKHLNKNCWYPVYAHLSGDKNVSAGFTSNLYGAAGQNMKVGQKVRRCSFQSLEFVDIDDLAPMGNSVLMVETV